MKRLLSFAFLMVCIPIVVHAHCDTLNGPVIADARLALQKGDVTQVLKWVKKENEAEIRDAFAKTISVRANGGDAKDLADMYFFETLVRIHRNGEGAPYTGLKSSDSIEPGIGAADDALTNGSVDALIRSMSADAGTEIRERFGRVLSAKKDADASVEKGRAYVEAYVGFIHYVERLHHAISTEAGEQEHE